MKQQAGEHLVLGEKENVSPMEPQSHVLHTTTSIPSFGHEQRRHVPHQGPDIVSRGKVFPFVTIKPPSTFLDHVQPPDGNETETSQEVSLISPLHLAAVTQGESGTHPSTAQYPLPTRIRSSARLSESAAKTETSSVSGRKRSLSESIITLEKQDSKNVDMESVSVQVQTKRKRSAVKQTPSNSTTSSQRKSGKDSILFPQRLHNFVCEATKKYPGIIEWICDGAAFKVTDALKLESILGKYFNHSNWPSLQRQLNMYGWKKYLKGDYPGAFYHPDFHRDLDKAKDLSKFERRHSSSQSNGHGQKPRVRAESSRKKGQAKTKVPAGKQRPIKKKAKISDSSNPVHQSTMEMAVSSEMSEAHIDSSSLLLCSEKEVVIPDYLQKPCVRVKKSRNPSEQSRKGLNKKKDGGKQRSSKVEVETVDAMMALSKSDSACSKLPSYNEREMIAPLTLSSSACYSKDDVEMPLTFASPSRYAIQSEFANVPWSPLFDFVVHPNIDSSVKGSQQKITPPVNGSYQCSSFLQTPCNATIDSFTCVTENNWIDSDARNTEKEGSSIVVDAEDCGYLLCHESIDDLLD